MEVVELDGGSCNGSLLLSAFANLTEYFTTELNMTYYAIIGAHCLQETKILQTVLSKMLHQENFAVPIISLIPLPQRDREVFSMIPPANDLINAFYLLCKHLNWTRIGLLTDISDHYMQRTSEYVVMQSRKQGVTISPVLEFNFKHPQHVLDILEERGIKVILLSARNQGIHHILCAAYDKGMTWPSYGWVLYHWSLYNIQAASNCSLRHYLDGVVFITNDFRETPTVNISQNFQSQLMTSLTMDAIGVLNPAIELAHTTMVDLAKALTQISYTGITGQIEFSNDHIAETDRHFIQIKNHSAFVQDSVKNSQLSSVKWLPGNDLPITALPIQILVVYPTWLGAAEVAVCLIVTTATPIIYLYYRNKVDIRATSLPMSLLLLLGCYLIIAYLLALTFLYTYPPVPTINLCPLLVWTSGVGLSYLLILAVLLVKMLRVYHIFHSSTKVRRMSSNVALVLFVFLILLPSIAVLTAMTVTKIFTWTAIKTIRRDFIEEEYR